MVFCITLVGCNTKKEKKEYIECSTGQSTDGFDLKASVKFTLKDNKLDSSVFIAEYILNETYMQYQDEFADGLEKEFLSFEQQYGVNAEIEKIDNGVRVTIDMTREQLEKIYKIDVDEKVTKEELTEEFENNGYTCK